MRAAAKTCAPIRLASGVRTAAQAPTSSASVDRPFGGPDPPAAVYFFSRDRSGDHPERHLAHYGGIRQADAYAGFNALYKDGRVHGPITEASCWAHARRKFFVLADITNTAKSKKPLIVS